EVDAIDARIALQLLQSEDQRPLHEPMDHQAMIGGIDLGNAAMMPLEAEPVRRDDAFELVQRREADGGLPRGGGPFDGAPDDILLELRWLAVGTHGNALAQRLGPFRYVGWLVRRIAARARGPREHRRRNAGTRGQKTASGLPGIIRLRHRSHAPVTLTARL